MVKYGGFVFPYNHFNLLVWHCQCVLVDSPVVLYGLSKQLELRQTIGISQTYKGSDMCEAPANSTGFWDPGYIHSFILSDLQIGRMYYYSFGGENVSNTFARCIISQSILTTAIQINFRATYTIYNFHQV